MSTEKQGVVKKVAIDPEDWQKIVEYLVKAPIRFEDAESIVELKSIIEKKVLWVDLKLDEQPEVK